MQWSNMALLVSQKKTNLFANTRSEVSVIGLRQLDSKKGVSHLLLDFHAKEVFNDTGSAWPLNSVHEPCVVVNEAVT